MSRRVIVVQLAAGLAAFTYVHCILNGVRPGDLPVRQASHLHLTLNQATAHAVALRMPHEFELRINEVIA